MASPFEPLERKMRWHEEVLDSDAISAAERLSKCVGDRFYLAGGTALALRIGHRVSLDLDLFSEKIRLEATERIAVLDRLKTGGAMRVRKEAEGTIHLSIGKTEVSLFHYPYRLLEATTPWRGLPVAGLADIAAMKLSAVLGRGARKDFVDLYWLASKLGVPALLDAAAKRFPLHSEFPLQACRALVYFDDAEKEPMPRMLAKVNWVEVKSFFEREAPRAIRSRVGKS